MEEAEQDYSKGQERTSDVKWGDKVCPQCGGGLCADSADIALVCVACGHRERPPRPGGGRPGLPVKQPTSSVSPASEREPTVPRVVLVEVRPESRRLLEGVCAAHGCGVVSCSGAPSSAGEAMVRGVGFFIIEADRGGLAVVLARRLRIQAPAVPIAVVLTCWSECELEARSAAEFVLHAPLRKSEVTRVLEIVGSYGGWLPLPLLPVTHRARATE